MSRELGVARLLAALERSDVRGVAATLSARARLLHDAGDATGGEARGRAGVARALVGIRMRFPAAEVHPARVNGAPGGVIRTIAGQVVAVIALGGSPRIRDLWVTTAEYKLERWQLPRALS
ncbi:MAG TPA: hypothetical protein VFN04_05790 [Protaetiibacter sp.]|nr:hypothetical protein [Protaetiibacter sp.]